MKILIRNCLGFFFPLLFVYAKLQNYFSSKSRVIVLIFHDLSEQDYSKFNRVIIFLKKHFKFISPDEFDLYMEGKVYFKGLSFLVTFDDGFASSKIAAEKILDPVGIKALFFICPTFIGLPSNEAKNFVSANIYQSRRQINEILDQELPMSKSEVEGLNVKGHGIACHTVNHLELSSLNPLEISEELRCSKEILSSKFPYSKRWLAYPFGKISCVNEEVIGVVSKYYKYCFSGVRGVVDTRYPLGIPRISVTLADWYWLQLALIFGATNFFHYKKRQYLFSLGKQSYKNSPDK